MTTKEFSIEINTTPERVWFALWDEYYYRHWTSVFCEGSYAESDWVEGGKIHFLSPGGNGMYSEITCNKAFEKMHFTHIGEIRNFEEQPLSDEVKTWTGARENYDLNLIDGSVALTVTLDLDEKHADFFAEVFPKGLALVKQSAENLMVVIETEVLADMDKVWNYWTNPEYIVQWNYASQDWHTTKATNDLRVGGKFMSRMEAKDGSFGFDFDGEYTEVVLHKTIRYKLGDNRRVDISFLPQEKSVKIIEKFDHENEFPIHYQKAGWLSILLNFKKLVEEGN